LKDLLDTFRESGAQRKECVVGRLELEVPLSALIFLYGGGGKIRSVISARDARFLGGTYDYLILKFLFLWVISRGLSNRILPLWVN